MKINRTYLGFLCAVALLQSRPLSLLADEYSLAMVPHLTGQAQTSGNFLNDACMLTVGENQNINQSLDVFHQWVMTRGQLNELGRMHVTRGTDGVSFAFERMAFVAGLNNAGKVVGVGIREDRPYGLKWQNGSLSEFPAPAEGHSFVPSGMNDLGISVGAAVAEDQSSSFPVSNLGRVYNDLRRTGIQAVNDINNRMTIVGLRQDKSTERWFSVVKALGRPLRRFAEFLGASSTTVSRINDRGLAIGAANFANLGGLPFRFFGVVWPEPDQLIDLGQDVILSAVNNAGKVVGTRYTQSQLPQGVIWDRSNNLRNLEDLLPQQYRGSLRVTDASAVNSLGQILVSVMPVDVFSQTLPRGAAILYPAGSPYPCALGH